MSTIYRRRLRQRAGQGNFLLRLVMLVIFLGLGLSSYFLYGARVKEFFAGKPPVTEYSNKEANDNLERLMASLSGSKAELLQFAEDSKTSLGWIKNPKTRQQMRWVLMQRLIDEREWQIAMTILPEVQHLATIDHLDRLAVAAREHNDIELELQLDRRLQDLAMKNPNKVRVLLRSIRRSAETAIILKREDEALRTLSRLELPAIQARLTDPKDAATAAELLMLCAEISAVKEPVLQKVRNILEAAKWPESSATAELLINEISNTLRDNKVLPDATLKEIESRLLHSRDSIFFDDKQAKLILKCYLLLSELRFKMKNYEGCLLALNMADAFSESYGMTSKEMKLRIVRMRLNAHEARESWAEAMLSIPYLLEHDTDPVLRLRCLFILATHKQGEEKIQSLQALWDFIKADDELTASHVAKLSEIASTMADYYKKEEKYNDACAWIAADWKLVCEMHPDLIDGARLNRQYDLAMINRKAKNDRTAINNFKSIVNSIEKMSDEERSSFDSNNSRLYKNAVRELARTYILLNETYYARQVLKKIKEGMPAKLR